MLYLVLSRMGLRSKKSIFYTMLTNISRVVLALVLVLSGFVKAVDPQGTMYKLQEYADAFSVNLFSADWLLFLPQVCNICGISGISGVHFAYTLFCNVGCGFRLWLFR